MEVKPKNWLLTGKIGSREYIIQQCNEIKSREWVIVWKESRNGEQSSNHEI